MGHDLQYARDWRASKAQIIVETGSSAIVPRSPRGDIIILDNPLEPQGRPAPALVEAVRDETAPPCSPDFNPTENLVCPPLGPAFAMRVRQQRTDDAKEQVQRRSDHRRVA